MIFPYKLLEESDGGECTPFISSFKKRIVEINYLCLACFIIEDIIIESVFQNSWLKNHVSTTLRIIFKLELCRWSIKRWKYVKHFRNVTEKLGGTTKICKNNGRDFYFPWGAFSNRYCTCTRTRRN